MNLRPALGWLALLAGGAALGIAVAATLVVVVLSAGGVLTTPPGAWVVHLRPLPGMQARLSVPGLVRFATSPAALRLLDGRSLATRFGTLRLARDGSALQVVCAPCRFEWAKLAAPPIRIERLQLRLARSGGQSLTGELSGDGVEAQFTARLAPERIDVDWRLPSTEIAAIYRLLGSVIPEAHLAHIEGRLDGRGSLRLPQRRARVELAIDGMRVEGLGTERLAAGPLEFGCPSDGDAPVLRRVTPGEGRWISPTQSGALLAAAVLAAEDQRFRQHEGFDRAEIASVLASADGAAPARGASTITQQLARTLFTGSERSGARKLRELLYAVEMERTVGKGLILALYLNTVHWGPGICGADAAARAYFAKRPGELTPLEAAWLASILPNPQRAFDEEFLADMPEQSRAIRVLQQMRGLPRRERERWSQQSLVFAEPATARRTEAQLAVAR
jgi:monofunctional biosynthetic peptidoglycan transglycosylase